MSSAEMLIIFKITGVYDCMVFPTRQNWPPLSVSAEEHDARVARMGRYQTLQSAPVVPHQDGGVRKLK